MGREMEIVPGGSGIAHPHYWKMESNATPVGGRCASTDGNMSKPKSTLTDCENENLTRNKSQETM